MTGRVLVSLACVVLAAGAAAAQQKPPGTGTTGGGSQGTGGDALALFGPMPNFKVEESETVEFDYYTFGYLPGTPRIEGRRTTTSYGLNPGSPMPGALGICRHFADATRQAGGEVLYDNDRNIVVLRFNQQGLETWAEIACDKDRYRVNIIEREGGTAPGAPDQIRHKHITQPNWADIRMGDANAGKQAQGSKTPGDFNTSTHSPTEIDGAAARQANSRQGAAPTKDTLPLLEQGETRTAPGTGVTTQSPAGANPGENGATGPVITGITVPTSIVVAGTPASMVVLGTGACDSIQVDFGEFQNVVTMSGVSLPASIQHTYKSRGPYSVKVQALAGCSGSASGKFWVGGVATGISAPSQASPGVYSGFSASWQGDCQAMSFYNYFTAQITGVAFKELLVIEPPHDHLANYRVTFSEPGTATLTVNTFDPHVCAGGPFTATIAVFWPEVTGISVSADPVTTRPAFITLSGKSLSCPALRVDFGDGASQTLNNISFPHHLPHRYAAAKTYTITATGTTLCIGKATTNVTVSLPNLPPKPTN